MHDTLSNSDDPQYPQNAQGVHEVSTPPPALDVLPTPVNDPPLVDVDVELVAPTPSAPPVTAQARERQASAPPIAASGIPLPNPQDAVDVAFTAAPPAAVPPAASHAPSEASDVVASDEDGEHSETPDSERGSRSAPRRIWRETSAVFVSTLLHAALFAALAVWLLPSMTKTKPPIMVINTHESSDRELDQIELNDLESTSFEAVDGSEGLVGVDGLPTGLADPAFESDLSAQLSATPTKISVGQPLDGAPDKLQMIDEVPDGAVGDPRVIVDGYDDAFDQITREIMWMLSKSKVQITWCFDQSESMEDDQKEIRDRIKRVYNELGLLKQQNDALTSSVTSFGQGFLSHTKRPTSDVRSIETAIESVPVDPSGKEMMCQAIVLSIQRQLEYVKRESRQMALILVTDESGDPQSNLALLEQAIETARAAECRVYVLGRESVFGYPFAHMRWIHPFTKHEHWLPVDRGPETAFVQQLQTAGFRRRFDAHPSGFGPYEQCRIARESGGIFFMLPSLETKLVRGEKRRYELAAMRPYLPDLGRRDELLTRRDQSRLQTYLWKIINDLNPYNPEVAKIMEVSYDFSADPATFLTQARREQVKARLYLEYLDRAAVALEQIRYDRDQEALPRWQANYDLIYAQVLAYTARTYEYIAYLEMFIARPKIVPLEKPKFLRLSSWHIHTTRATVGGEVTSSYIQRSSDLFQEILREHPSTPWAARAEKELARGFGIELRERYHYYGPRPPSTRTNYPKIPIPTL